MNRTPFFLFFLGLFLVSCSDEGGSNPLSAVRGSNQPPRIMSAELYPKDPDANTKIIVHYRGEDPEGDFIQYSFRWYVDNEMVQEGNSGALEPGKHYKGAEVYVEIIPRDSKKPGRAFKTEPVIVANLPPVIKSIALSPADPKAGDDITAEPDGFDSDQDDVSYTYQWFVNGKAVTEQLDSKTFSTRALRKKDMVHAVVMPLDNDGPGEGKASAVLVLGNRPPRITSTPPANLNSESYSYQVTAADPDQDTISLNLEKAPPGMTISPTGLIRWLPPKQVAGKQEIPVRIKADDGDGGSAYQEYSLFLQMQ